MLNLSDLKTTHLELSKHRSGKPWLKLTFENGYTASIIDLGDGSYDIGILQAGHIDSTATEYEPAEYCEDPERAQQRILEIAALPRREQK